MKPFWVALGVLLLVSRAAHVNILWADEDYHLAAAIQILHGKTLYRDLWYDKPPLNALLLALAGGWPGWPLRLVSVALELGGAAVAFQFARRLWGRREGYVAAGAFVFFHVFYFSSTAIPVEPDTLMVLPHLLAVYLAWRGKAFLAGVASGAAFLLNTKGLFVLAACFLFAPAGWLRLGAGFLVPCAAAAGWLMAEGAWSGYLDQVWRWGMLYASHPPPEEPYQPLVRFGNWTAFHGALALGSALAWHSRADRALGWRFGLWLALSVAAVAIGRRVAPHYMNQLYPPLVILGSAGITAAWARGGTWRYLMLAAFLIPAARFAPRTAQLLAENWRGQPHDWRDTTMDRESRDGAAIVNRLAQPGDTIFVWGYRPNVVVYTRLPVAGRMWESQPVTMVPADRHLSQEVPVDAGWALENEKELFRTRPTFVVDGLSAYNVELDWRKRPRVAAWMEPYCEVGKAGQGMTVYRLCR